jgi:hypothetical protein
MPRSEKDKNRRTIMLTQTNLNEKSEDKYKLSLSRVVKKLVPIDPTLLIIRAALGTILMFLVLMAHELAGVGGIVFVCILFAIGVSAPFWLTRRKKNKPHKDMMKR